MATDDPLTPEERAFFTSRGEKPIPTPPEAPAEPPPEAPADPALAADKEPPVQDLKKDDKPEPQVPYGALKEAREKNEQLAQRLRDAEIMQARMEERWKTLSESMKPPAEAPKPPPRPDQDIFGAVEHLAKEVDRRGKEIDGYKERLTAEERQKQMDQWAKQHEADFVQKTAPDYLKALHFLRLGRSAELTAMGVPEAAIGERLNMEERALMQHAANQKQSPAELAYKIAKARGYNKDMRLPGWDERQAPTAPVAKPDLKSMLERVEAGQKQSGSMSDIGGTGKPPADITLKDLANLSERDFAAYMDKFPDKYQRLKRGAFN